MPEGSKVVLQGIIVAAYNGEHALVFAENKQAPGLIVKIPPALKSRFSPKLQSAVKGRRIEVKGTLQKYSGRKGLVKVTSLRFL